MSHKEMSELKRLALRISILAAICGIGLATLNADADTESFTLRRFDSASQSALEFHAETPGWYIAESRDLSDPDSEWQPIPETEHFLDDTGQHQLFIERPAGDHSSLVFRVIRIKDVFRPTLFPESATRCPITATECPARRTECATAPTVCPTDPTPTKCPKKPTVCVSLATECPTVPTACPVKITECVSNPRPTFCAETAVMTIMSETIDRMRYFISHVFPVAPHGLPAIQDILSHRGDALSG